MTGFLIPLAYQAWLVPRFGEHPSTFLVPLQALALGLVALSPPPREAQRLLLRPWRDPFWIGWGLFSIATAVQALLYSPWPLGQREGPASLLVTQLLLAGVGVALVISSGGEREETATPRGTLEAGYLASILMTLTVVGVAPAYLFYQPTFFQRLETLVRYHQVEVVGGLHNRSNRIREINRKGGLPPLFDSLSLRDEVDLPYKAFFPIPQDTINPKNSLRLFKYGEFPTIAFIENRVPLISAVAVNQRQLTREGIAGYDWTLDQGNILRLSGPPEVESALPRGLETPTWWWCVLPIAYFLLWLLSRWLGRRVFLLDLERIDPISLSDQIRLRKTSGPESWIVVCTRSMDRDKLEKLFKDAGFDYSDLEETGKVGDATPLLRFEGTDTVIDHFDFRFDEKAWREPLLAALEELVYVYQKRVILFTSREIDALVPLLEEAEGEEIQELRRWTRLLGNFTTIPVAGLIYDDPAEVKDPDAGKDKESKESRLAAETAETENRPGNEPPEPDQETSKTSVTETHPDPDGPTSDWVEGVIEEILGPDSSGFGPLRRIADQLARRKGCDALTTEARLGLFREMADRYFHALWWILDKDERLVVAQLAAGVVVSPGCKRAIRRLLARGILVRAPELRLMHPCFATFVREEVPGSLVSEWERKEPISAWQRLRFPLLLGVAVVVAFLFVTQRTAFDSLVAILTTAAVGTTALLRVISVARSSDGGGGK